MWQKFCPNNPKSEKNHQGGPAAQSTCTEYDHITYTLNAMVMDFTRMTQAADDGLSVNPCLPTVLTDDPVYALLTQDPWYVRGMGRR